MTIKQQGGIFGRNPTFNDVTVNDVTANQVQVDNININGNAITSTDTDGNIDITPNGDGVARFLGPEVSLFFDGKTLRYFDLGTQAPTSNQVTLTIETADTTAKYGNGLLEIFLCGNGNSSDTQYSYLSYIPISVRAGASLVTVHSSVDQTAAGFSIAAGSPTTSGTTITIVFDVNATVIDVGGYVLSRGPMGFATSATLT